LFLLFDIVERQKRGIANGPSFSLGIILIDFENNFDRNIAQRLGSRVPRFLWRISAKHGGLKFQP